MDPLEPSLVPELLVADLDRSVKFWCDFCGFDVAYSRPEERFAYITLGSAHLMLEQAGVGRNWITGPLERPLGRGVIFQITVLDSEALAQVLGQAGVELFMRPEAKWLASERKRSGCINSSSRTLTDTSCGSSRHWGDDQPPGRRLAIETRRLGRCGRHISV
ncbi:VOC family protein [Curtobacterium sp. VKM Ac-2852]|uniref:VOC family protein n=1 Tax=Curtobacterium sp. VKM Ac-2852 TaxID=2739024 RepID=UPI001C206CF7|nr:VOC family protein [Curtobacterium sp. VKM Ac-2852]